MKRYPNPQRTSSYYFYRTFITTLSQHCNPNPRPNSTIPTMSSVLSVEIARALFPSFFNTTSTTTNSTSHIKVQPAENLELLPLPDAMKTSAIVRHRSTSTASTASSGSCTASDPKRKSWGHAAPFPHVGLAMLGPR